jgi:inner membrane transporter RhtA
MQILDRLAEKVPPHLWFGVSAVFHYLGPSFAVLLFPSIGILGVAWLRIASAAVIFAPFTRPVTTLRRADGGSRLLLVGLGVCLALMNVSFYLALSRLPVSLVAAMEFVATLCVALIGMRTVRNLGALALASLGVFLLIGIDWSSDLVGLGYSALNAALFAVYIVLGHKAAERGGGAGVERLGAAMLVALLVAFPIGFGEAIDAFSSPVLLLAAIGVGLSSSVIPYISDQLAMSRLPRATFALMLSLLPATATAIAAIVLSQIPTMRDLVGVLLVMLGVALHKPRREPVVGVADAHG